MSKAGFRKVYGKNPQPPPKPPEDDDDEEVDKVEEPG